LVAAVAALVYLASYGARTPLLALRGLLRFRNALLVLVPAVALGVVARLIEAYLPGASDGAFAVALVPAPLMASEVVTRLRGRMDLAGALVLGTMVFSVFFVGSRTAVAAGALFAATESFTIAAMVANAIPTLRDAVLLPLRVVGWLAAGIVVGLAILFPPRIDGTVVIAAAALLVVGALSAAIVAMALQRDVIASVAGAGLRDPALAVAVAMLTDSSASGVALVYGVFCLVLGGAVALRAR
jgi:hypothetical protein